MIKGNSNQKKFIRRVAKVVKSDDGNVNLTKEYLKVYPDCTKASAQAQSSALINSEYGKQTLAELLDRDYPRTKRAKRLEELANAEKDHVLQDGTIIPIRDNNASLRSLELIMKVTGDLRPDGSVDVDARSVHYHISADEAAKLAALADKLERLENDSTGT
jgi:hypothetical protein